MTNTTPSNDQPEVSPRPPRPAGPLGYALDALVVLTFLALIAVAFPRYVKARDGWREDEVKANLKVIQVALERYAVDHDGTYPVMLYGGDRYDTFTTSDSPVISEFPGDVDWLIQHGYLTYPQNPFRRGSRAAVRVDPRELFDVDQPPITFPDTVTEPRINLWALGGRHLHTDRSQQLALRFVGGPSGELMWDVSEGQRHPPFQVHIATNPDPVLLRSVREVNPPAAALALDSAMNQQNRLAPGNFYYLPLHDPSGTARWLHSYDWSSPRGDYSKPSEVRIVGYRLAAFGSALNLGQDVFSLYGDFPDSALNGPAMHFPPLGIGDIDAWHARAPDGRPDGVIQVLNPEPLDKEEYMSELERSVRGSE